MERSLVKMPMLLMLLVALMVTNTNAVLPGLKVIASQSGLDYVGSQAVQVVSKQAMGQPIPDQSGTADVTVGKVDYWLTGMTVTRFNPPTSSITIQSGKGVTWSLQGASLGVHGDWRYEYKEAFIHIKDHGDFDVSASGIGIIISVTLEVTADVLTIKSTACSSTIGDVSIKFHGGPSWLYNIFDHYVEKALKSNLQDTMCKAATQAVDVDLAKQFANIKWVIPVANLVDFDYSVITSPDFQTSFLATFHKGEVYWIGSHTEAPFQPTPFPDVGQPQMLTVMVSDYVISTMAYVMQQHGQIQHNLTKDELPDKDQYILNTTCSNGACIGSLLPQVGKLYPGLSMELDMATTQAPTLNILPQDLHGNFTGFIDYYVRLDNGSRAFLFSTDLNVTTDFVAYSEGMVIKFNVTNITPEIKVTKSAIGKLYDNVLELVFKTIANVFIVPKLNELGQQGLELPSLENVKYVNPTLKLFQGALVLSTDLQYDPSALYFQESKKYEHRDYQEYQRLVQMLELSNARRFK